MPCVLTPTMGSAFHAFRDGKALVPPSFPCARVAVRHAPQRPTRKAAVGGPLPHLGPFDEETWFRIRYSHQEQEAIKALVAALKKHIGEWIPGHLEYSPDDSAALAAVGPDAITQRCEALLALLPDHNSIAARLLLFYPETILSAPSGEMLRRIICLADILGMSLTDLFEHEIPLLDYTNLLHHPYQLEELRTDTLWLEGRIREHLPEAREPHALAQALVRASPTLMSFFYYKEDLVEVRLQELAAYKDLSPVATDLAEQGYPAAEEDVVRATLFWLAQDAYSKPASYLRYLLVYGKDVPEPRLDPFDRTSAVHLVRSSDNNFERFHDDWQRKTQDLARQARAADRRGLRQVLLESRMDMYLNGGRTL